MQLREWAPDSGVAGILYLKRVRLVRGGDRIERGKLVVDMRRRPDPARNVLVK